MTMLVYAGVFALVIAVFMIAAYVKRRREQAMAIYAAGQGWQALAADGATLAGFLPQALAGRGDDHRFDMAYSLKIGDYPAAVFQYQYDEHTESYDPATRMPERQTQTFSFAVLTFTLPQTFLPLYVQRHTLLSGLGGYERQEKLQVEGDFNKHFEVYTPQGTEVEALAVLTPDLMALMEDAGQNFSLQLMGRNISIFGDDSYISPGKVSTLVDYAGQLAAKLGAKAGVTAG